MCTCRLRLVVLPAADKEQMTVWGVISAATAGCNSFGGLLAARFFLGFVEAVYFVRCSVTGAKIIMLTLASLAVSTTSAAGTRERSWASVPRSFIRDP